MRTLNLMQARYLIREIRAVADVLRPLDGTNEAIHLLNEAAVELAFLPTENQARDKSDRLSMLATVQA